MNPASLDYSLWPLKLVTISSGTGVVFSGCFLDFGISLPFLHVFLWHRVTSSFRANSCTLAWCSHGTAAFTDRVLTSGSEMQRCRRGERIQFSVKWMERFAAVFNEEFEQRKKTLMWGFPCDSLTACFIEISSQKCWLKASSTLSFFRICFPWSS